MDVITLVLFTLVVYTIAVVIGLVAIEIVKRIYRFFVRLFKNGKENNV